MQSSRKKAMADDTSNKSKENAKDVQELKEHQLEGISGGASQADLEQYNNNGASRQRTGGGRG